MKRIVYFSIFFLFIFFRFQSFSQNFLEDKNQLQQEIRQQKDILFLIEKNRDIPVPEHIREGIRGHISAGFLLVSFQDIPALNEMNWIRSWAVYEPQLKYNPKILEWCIKEGNQYLVYVSVDKKLSDTDFFSLIQALGLTPSGTQKWKHYKLWQISIKDENELRLLAVQPWVLHMTPVTEDVNLNDEATALTGADIVQSSIPGIGEGLSGQGIIVGIGDDGMTFHADLNARVIQNFNPGKGSGHAVHVATTGFGAGIKDELYTGFAPEAEIISQFFSAVIAYGITLHEDFNMSLTNNSYAARIGDCDFAGTYTDVSNYLDQMSLDYPKLLHVFAAGNDGAKTCPPYPLGFGTTVGSYQPSKNTLTVANMGKSIHWFHPSSSRGPVKDGRIKPEIAGIGRMLESGGLNDSYFANSGTSMSSPNVAGAAALLSEQFQTIYPDSLPDNALLKIILMNGATDVYHFGPDFRYGFGMMDIQRSSLVLKNNQFLKGQIAHGENITHSVSIPPGVSRAKVMVYWNDLPAIPTADPSISKLINDLDLKVVIPSSETVLPWILDPDSPDEPAIHGIDHINNVEQVTIENPAAGTYQVQISGFNIIEGEQDYYIAWDFEPDTISLLSPVGGEHMVNGDSIKVFFKSPVTTSSFSCLLSLDNGTTWTTLSSDIPSAGRDFTFFAPADLNSPNCKIKIMENTTGQEVSSGIFTISNRITVNLNDDVHQCPGSISISWNPLSFASGYVLFQEISGKMTPVDTVAAIQSQYTFTGLNHYRKQWVSVAPLIDGKLGIRGIAMGRIPNSGSCTDGQLPAADLAVMEVINPKNGRIWTSRALGDHEIVSVKVQNRSKNTLTAASLSFILDGAAPVSESFDLDLIPGADTILEFTSHPLDLSVVGVHHITVYYESPVSESIRWNDTISLHFSQIDNPVIDMEEGYVENFESMPVLALHGPFLGLEGAGKWDYQKTAGYGRLKSFVNSDVSINGTKAVSMDLDYYATAPYDSASTNSLIATVNLSETDVNNMEIRMDFLYKFSGRPKFLNEHQVYIRGTDTAPWLPVLTLDTSFAGTLRSSGTISLNDYFLSAGQLFSTSTQLKIEQRDTSLICGADFGNGLTIDSFRLYAVTNDASMDRIVSPVSHGCEMGTEEQITVAVRNNVFYPLENITVAYQLNGGPVRTETIGSVPSKTTVQHTFSAVEDLSELGSYRINAWVVYPDDSYPYNDSILKYEIYHAPVIDTFPYIQDFESDKGAFRTIDSSSFVWGTPNNAAVRQAANGEKAWSASAIRFDTTRAVSYLYSPCFDISTLEHPYLSFSFSGNFPFEDSAVPSSYAYVEYSTDGILWERLGAYHSGHNWYNHESNFWALEDFPWTGVTHELPETGGNISLRWVFVSFPGSRTSNLGIDDIHIYSSERETWEASGEYTAEFDIGGATVIEDGAFIYADIGPSGDLGNTTFSMFNRPVPVITRANEAILPTSFILDHTGKVTKELKFYVPHQSVALLAASGCASCYRPNSIYDLSISNYQSVNSGEYNDVLEDNLSGTYTLVPKEDIYYLPFRNGYIVQFRSEQNGEFWFNSSEQHHRTIDFIPIQFSGKQNNNVVAVLNWISEIEPLVSQYYLEWLNADGEFVRILNQGVDPVTEGRYSHTDQPAITDGSATYRLRYDDHNGNIRYTHSVTLNWENMGTFSIYPNPVYNSVLHIAWDINELQPLIYRIVDISGRLITKSEWTPDAHKGILNIQINELGIAPGNYVIELFNGREKISAKLVYVR